MSDDQERSTTDNQNKAPDLDFSFAPDWARDNPDTQSVSHRVVQSQPYEYEGQGHARKRYNNDYHDTAQNRRLNRRDSKQAGSEQRYARKERRSWSEQQAGKGSREFASSGSEQGAHTGREDGEQRRRSRGRSQRPEANVPDLPLEVRLLPDPKSLGIIIRRIQTSHRAYPLHDLARLFLDNPAACQIKLDAVKGERIPLFQCKQCGMPALSAESIQVHLLTHHLEDFFDKQEIECDPPGGDFVCVAKCGITGELLGPPNHHSFNLRVAEILQSRFPDMPESKYRERIETVRDTEVIEEWRQLSAKKFVYIRKATKADTDVKAPAEIDPKVAAVAEAEVNISSDDADTSVTDGVEMESSNSESAVEIPFASDTEPDNDQPEAVVDQTDSQESETLVQSPVDEELNVESVGSVQLERKEMETLFNNELVPGLITKSFSVIAPLKVALQTPDRTLYFTIKNQVRKEQRYPASLLFALRGAFRHRKLCFFRAQDARGPDFVTYKAFVALDLEHAIPELRAIVGYVTDNPVCTKGELVQSICADNQERAREVLTQLAWLIQNGHLIEYFNETLSVPAKYPVFKLPEKNT